MKKQSKADDSRICNDMVICIFQFLDAKTLFLKACLVNKNWNFLARSEPIYKELCERISRSRLCIGTTNMKLLFENFKTWKILFEELKFKNFLNLPFVALFFITKDCVLPKTYIDFPEDNLSDVVKFKIYETVTKRIISEIIPLLENIKFSFDENKSGFGEDMFVHYELVNENFRFLGISVNEWMKSLLSPCDPNSRCVFIKLKELFPKKMSSIKHGRSYDEEIPNLNCILEEMILRQKFGNQMNDIFSDFYDNKKK